MPVRIFVLCSKGDYRQWLTDQGIATSENIPHCNEVQVAVTKYSETLHADQLGMSTLAGDLDWFGNGYCFRVYVTQDFRNMAVHPAHVLLLIDCMERGARAIREFAVAWQLLNGRLVTKCNATVLPLVMFVYLLGGWRVNTFLCGCTADCIITCNSKNH
jgi:hypothetical protein